jgi:hypothetical protein
MVHYLPLRKDFANLDEILDLQADEDVRRELTSNAFRDLIASGRYDARRLVEHVDQTLAENGVRGSAGRSPTVAAALAQGARRRRARAELRHSLAGGAYLVYRTAPEPVLRRLRAARRGRWRTHRPAVTPRNGVPSE